MTLETLQCAADEIDKHERLSKLDAVICNHDMRRFYIQQASFAREFSPSSVPWRASRGLPNHWAIFVYGDRWFGVNTDTGIYEEISREVFKS